jgi:hypothetical protein
MMNIHNDHMNDNDVAENISDLIENDYYNSDNVLHRYHLPMSEHVCLVVGHDDDCRMYELK